MSQIRVVSIFQAASSDISTESGNQNSFRLHAWVRFQKFPVSLFITHDLESNNKSKNAEESSVGFEYKSFEIIKYRVSLSPLFILLRFTFSTFVHN